MENDTESPAQDPNLPDEGNEVAKEAAEKAKQADGFQKRIDELTAKAGEAERRAAAMHEQNMALITSQLAGQRQQEVADPYPDMDPGVRKMVADITGSMKREFQGQIARLQANHESDLMAREARAEAAAMGADDALQKEAAMYAGELRKKGIPINAEDAAVYAMGRALKEGRFKPGGSQQRNGAPATIGTVRSANINQVQHAALPSNFDDLDPDSQIALLHKRGAGNEPL